MGAQLACQALASFAISVELIPAVYRHAELPGASVCYGKDCFFESFVSLAGLDALGLGCALWLAHRNRTSLPVDRLPS
jgi:hypothetical protein